MGGFLAGFLVIWIFVALTTPLSATGAFLTLTGATVVFGGLWVLIVVMAGDPSTWSGPRPAAQSTPIRFAQGADIPSTSGATHAGARDRIEYGDFDDTWDVAEDWEGQYDSPRPARRKVSRHVVLAPSLNLNVEIDYPTKEGGFRSRKVKVTRLVGTRDGLPTHMMGTDLMHGGHRTFLVERIQCLIDPSTGEVVDDIAGWLAGRKS